MEKRKKVAILVLGLLGIASVGAFALTSQGNSNTPVAVKTDEAKAETSVTSVTSAMAQDSKTEVYKREGANPDPNAAAARGHEKRVEVQQQQQQAQAQAQPQQHHVQPQPQQAQAQQHAQHQAQAQAQVAQRQSARDAAYVAQAERELAANGYISDARAHLAWSVNNINNHQSTKDFEALSESIPGFGRSGR